MRRVVKGKRLIDGTGREPIENPVVVIEDGGIVAVGPAQAVGIPEGAEVIDAGEKVLLPGLIDMHVHILQNGGPTSTRDFRAGSDQEALLTGARNACLALKAGLTTVRDCGGHTHLTLALREAIARGLIPGPRLQVSGAMITTTGGHCYYMGIEADTPDEVRKAVRSLVKEGVDFIKFVGTGGHATPGSNPEAPQYPLEGFEAVVEEARRLGKRVAVHLHGAEAIRMAAQAGIDTLEHCSWRSRGTIEYDERVAEEIARKGLTVSLALPASWYRLRLDQVVDLMDRAEREHLLEARYETIRRMYRAGIRLAASTDAGSTSTRIDEFALLLEFLVKTIGIPALDVIRMATLAPAQAMGLDDRLGSVEVGKRADIVILDGDPLADASALGRVDTVLKDGEIVVSEGRLIV